MYFGLADSFGTKLHFNSSRETRAAAPAQVDSIFISSIT